MNTDGYHVQFRVPYLKLLSYDNYSQPLPDDEPEGYVISGGRSGGGNSSFTVLVNAPDWLVSDMRKSGYQVQGRDQFVLFMTLDALEDTSDFEFDPADWQGRPNMYGSPVYSGKTSVFTQKTLLYMGLV
jgi:hypothetical protein